MTIIYIFPTTQIAPEKSFHGEPGATLTDLLILPRAARTALAISGGVTVRAIHHPKSETYAFVWHGVAYRAMANAMLPGVPVVLTGIDQSDHWQACKECRDGTWCVTGTGLIAAALEGGAA